MTRTLVVTNDFPPRPGGIQTFVHELVRRLDPADVVVLTSQWKGAAEFDAQQAYEVVRIDGSVLLPTPGVRRLATELVRDRGCSAVLFGAAVPLGLLAPALRDAGASRLVGLTHGHEAGWASVPGGRQVLRKVGSGLDVTTYLGEYTRSRIAAALADDDAARMQRLAPGVDDSVFRPGSGGDEVRSELGLGDRPVVVCVSRLMPRKGQDTLVRAWPQVLRRVPDAALLLVGGGPMRGRLERMVDDAEIRSSVVLTGSVPFDALPAHYDAGDVFAMPCRTRNGGLDVEGLGIVYLEASATGLPVVAGDSGGAPDAVLTGETGVVVDGRSPAMVASRLIGLLENPDAARAMGSRGREWVAQEWRWDGVAHRLAAMLDVEATD